jgi:hypothetical protein
MLLAAPASELSDVPTMKELNIAGIRVGLPALIPTRIDV